MKDGTRLAVLLAGHGVEIPDVRDLDFTAGAHDGDNFPVIAAFPRASRALNSAALVLDGNAEDARRTTGMLREAGFHPVVEASARGAARHVKKLGPPALLVAALEVPGAIEFVRNVRSRPRLADVAVIFFTGRTGAPDVKRALRAGADAYVVKTRDDKPFLQAVHTVFAA